MLYKVNENFNSLIRIIKIAYKTSRRTMYHLFLCGNSICVKGNQFEQNIP